MYNWLSSSTEIKEISKLLRVRVSVLLQKITMKIYTVHKKHVYCNMNTSIIALNICTSITREPYFGYTYSYLVGIFTSALVKSTECNAPDMGSICKISK